MSKCNSWLDLLEKFFKQHDDELAEVLDAANCRESWLQGELFRWFRFRQSFDTFAVNSIKIQNQTADFSSDEPTRLVGEIKVLGWDYQTKTITGGGIKPFLKRVNQTITVADRDLILGPWGLIPDFFRLVDFANGEKREAVLVLVVDERFGKDLSLARALRQINFVGPSRDVKFRAGVVRMWSILPIAPIK